MPDETGPILWDEDFPNGDVDGMDTVDDELRGIKARAREALEVGHFPFSHEQAGQHKPGSAVILVDTAAAIAGLDLELTHGNLFFSTDEKRLFVKVGSPPELVELDVVADVAALPLFEIAGVAAGQVLVYDATVGELNWKNRTPFDRAFEVATKASTFVIPENVAVQPVTGFAGGTGGAGYPRIVVPATGSWHIRWWTSFGFRETTGGTPDEQNVQAVVQQSINGGGAWTTIHDQYQRTKEGGQFALQGLFAAVANTTYDFQLLVRRTASSSLTINDSGGTADFGAELIPVRAV